MAAFQEPRVSWQPVPAPLGCRTAFLHPHVLNLFVASSSVGEPAKVSGTRPPQEKDPIHLLRIRIPPFQEPEEDLVLPKWPKRMGTHEDRTRTDQLYLERLVELAAGRATLQDRIHVASEILKYVYTYPSLCREYHAYANEMDAYAEKYMDLAEEVLHSDTSRTESRVKARVLHYGTKVRSLVEQILRTQ